MEFFPGAFEREWERRRAALLHELQMGQTKQFDWDLPRRGGAARLPDAGFSGGALRHRTSGRPAFRESRSGQGRSMRSRFEALARGSQPAVVKLASYGGGARAAAMMSYVSRNGELAVENEAGQRIEGKAALAELRSEWEYLFDNRAASRDIGMFDVAIERGSLTSDREQDEAIREILRAGFGDRRYVYAVEERDAGELQVRGVIVLRDRHGERLTGDSNAASIVQQRFDQSDVGDGVEAHFRLRGHGNGVEFGTARVRELVERHDGRVRDEIGRPIESSEQAGDLVQKEWRKELHSRKGRDVMHLIVSARAGTNVAAFQNSVREFLGNQFAGHRYLFALHDPSDDPKNTGEGGKRPHIHAHAIVTMRSETGERVETSPKVFRQWRSLMAEKAREHGIDMELTDRRDLASPPAYTRNQVRPVSYAGRTKHEGTSEAAQIRYDAKRANQHQMTGSVRSREYVSEVAEVWRELARENRETALADFAADQLERIHAALRRSRIDIEKRGERAEATKTRLNVVALREVIGGEETSMREMTRPEFQAYEKRVEAVLADVETAIEPWERKDFEEIAAAARDIVNIRREYLELTEQQADAVRGTDRSMGGDREEVQTSEQSASVLSDTAARRQSDETLSPAGAQAEQPRDSTPIGEVDRSADEVHGLPDDRSAIAEERRTARRQQGRGRQAESASREATPSASPRQQVPRLRELERDIEERHDRERDDRER
jgi:hypothetical protein